MSATDKTSKSALLSVSDRTGVVDLARALARHGYALLSTGGTARHLSGAGLAVREVSELTGFPEVFSGRVKTLHPKLFGGILFDRSAPGHVEEATAHDIGPIDVVAVNLYPFEATVADPDCTEPKAIEKIDVGGPSLLRSAAKNHAHVAVLSDPADYVAFAAELDANGGVSTLETRRKLAVKAFRRTASYDAAISAWLGPRIEREVFPESLPLSFERGAVLRYGENPHQAGAFYVAPAAPAAALARFAKVQGKELSYNNLLDADAALFGARALGPSSLVIVKHRIPSGAASAASAVEAFEAAWASDPIAGFGGVLAYTGVVDAAAAKAMAGKFLEVVVSHGLDDEAKAILAARPNLRVLTVAPETGARPRLEVRGIDGGLLVEQGDLLADDEGTWTVATRRSPSSLEMSSLRFAFRAVRGVVSNAIVVSTGSATLGIGGGRTSRVDACRDAVQKAGERAKGAVAASDAFFPFPDGLEVLAEAGVTAVVQPGGSARDRVVIETADTHGVAMVFTGRRHFRH